MNVRIASAFCITLALAGCANGKSGIATDLNVALDAAATAEGVYAARPNSDPQAVAEVARLLATAQAAAMAWQSSAKPEDQAIASAAIAALLQYEASAGVVP